MHGVAAYGGPKTWHIFIGAAAYGGWHKVCNAITSWRKFDSSCEQTIA